MKIINLNDKVFNVVSQYPETRQIIVDLGFHHMSDDAMLHTAGKIMTLAKAAKRHKLPLETMKAAFEKEGFTIQEDEV